MVPPDKLHGEGTDPQKGAPPATDGAARQGEPVAAEPRPERRVDTLLRCLLYVTQQMGRPVSEAELRALCPIPERGLDEPTVLLACSRMGFKVGPVTTDAATLARLPLPFILVGPGDAPSMVVTSRDGERFTVLDVIEGKTRPLDAPAIEIGRASCRERV